MATISTATMEHLFSYGTLQQPEVQLATFGRLLDSRPDRLPGYRLGLLAIDDAQVVATSGKTHHPIAARGDAADGVPGAVLAVILMGKGVAALQEAGWVGVTPVDFMRIDLLGILPTAETLLAQAAILAIIVAGYGWNRYSAGKLKPA